MLLIFSSKSALHVVERPRLRTYDVRLPLLRLVSVHVAGRIYTNAID